MLGLVGLVVFLMVVICWISLRLWCLYWMFGKRIIFLKFFELILLVKLEWFIICVVGCCVEVKFNKVFIVFFFGFSFYGKIKDVEMVKWVM